MTFEGIFEKVAMALLHIAVKFNTTYNAVNIIVYYCLVPLFWAIIIDYKFDMFACSLAVLSFWAGILCFDCHFIKDCTTVQQKLGNRLCKYLISKRK